MSFIHYVCVGASQYGVTCVRCLEHEKNEKEKKKITRIRRRKKPPTKEAPLGRRIILSCKSPPVADYQIPSADWDVSP